MDVTYTDKCWYYVQKQKEVPVWYTGIYQPISGTDSVVLLSEVVAVIVVSIIIETTIITVESPYME
jgi:hypothetical protein